MTESEINEEYQGWFYNFLDNIWLQFAFATGITVLWIIWIIYEILIKGAPGGA